MKILSIETSCDETAISIIEAEFKDDKPTFKILGNALHSQIETHADFGGVFPTLAKREHINNFTPILISALKDANMLVKRTASDDQENSKEGSANFNNLITDALSSLSEREQELKNQLQIFFTEYEKPEIDAIAVTTGPGLEPALWIGITGAKILSFIWQLPIIPVNHMEGHITSVLINEDSLEIEFPAVALLISGGHTELVQVNSWGDYKLLGQTRDDAVGEAFDKVARIIGLKYPGGPKISALAKRFRDGEFSSQNNSTNIPWDLPRPMITKKDCDFSFSGLKTSVLYAVRDYTKDKELDEGDKASLCAEFEQAVTDVLISKTKRALELSDSKTLIIGGGVSANTYIKESFKKMIEDELNYIKLLVPQKNLSTDNSLMIGIAGFLQYSKGNFITKIDRKHLDWNQTDFPNLKANGNLAL
jgi:N6-L-threonylcarbamoyladenine synthase